MSKETKELKEPKDTAKEINKEKMKALQLTMDKLEKTYGKGAIMKMGDTPIEEIEVISTGSVGLDAALGVGGFPKGRIIEIYGPESSGKTTIAIHAIAEAQKAGGIAAFIDAEHAFDRNYAEKLENSIWTNQFDNRANRLGHYKSTGPEIWRQTSKRN